MRPGLAARAVLVCTLLMGGISRADRLPVAVVDLGATTETANLATQLRKVLRDHLDLQRVSLPADETALAGELLDEDRQVLDDADRLLASADAQLAQFRPQQAISDARAGQERLLMASPRATRARFAELALTLAIAELAEKDPAAPAAFALVHRLAPERTLDPARYLPEVVEAFDHANDLAGVGQITVTGHGELWLDGVDVGAPRSLEVPAGLHFVQLAGIDRDTRGATVVVADRARLDVDILDAPSRHDQQVRRARVLLAQAGDAVSRASAMQYLAKLVGVTDAVLIYDPRHVEIWRAAGGFSVIKDPGKQEPIELLSGIAPPRTIVIDPPPPPPLKPSEETPWYRDRRYQVAGGVAVVIAVIAGIAWASSGTGSQLADLHPGFKTP